MPARARCTKCIYHGDNSFQERNHKRICPYLACECQKCVLLNERKVITEKLLRKPQPVKVADSNISRYTCSKCRRHGLIVSKKFHEPCQYILCKCEICKITVRKKQIDRELEHICRAEREHSRGNTPATRILIAVLLRSLLTAPTESAPSIVNETSPATHILSNQQITSYQRVHPMNSEENAHHSQFQTQQICSPVNPADVPALNIAPFTSQGVDDQLSRSMNSVPLTVLIDAPLLPEAQIMIDLISALTSSNDFSTIDYDAIRNFLITPSFDIPSTWSPHFPAIIELVHMALRKLPFFDHLEFMGVVE